MAQRKKKGKNTSAPISLRLTLHILLLTAAVGLMTGSGVYLQRRSARQRTEAVREELRRISELVTCRQTYRSVFYTSTKQNFIQERTLLFTAEFRVAAGLDLAEGFELETRGRRAEVLLPPGRILSIDADDTSLEQVFIRERFSTVTTGDYLPLLTGEKDMIRQKAEESGLSRRAEDRAAGIIRGILIMSGYEEVSVRFRRESLPRGDSA